MKLTDSIQDQIDARLQGIAAELFGPSSDTLAAVALGGDEVLRALPAQLQERLKAPEFVRQIEVMRNTLAEGEDVDRTPYLPTPSRGAEPLARGQIRVVEGVDLNDPLSERRHTDPVLVLLDRPVVLDGDSPARQSVVWQGWTVSRHAGFAGYWDALTQGADVPRSCAMVQVWNIVRVADPHLGRCRYRLSAEQQAAVDAVWLEFLSGVAEPSANELGLEGQITAGIRLTQQGQSVVTGSPSIGPEDPRFLFQQFYGLVREALGAACERVVAKPIARHGQPLATDVARTTAALEYAQLMSRVTLRGLHDGRIERAAGSRASARLVSDMRAAEQPLSAWIDWGGYDSKQQKLQIQLLDEIVLSVGLEKIRFEFFVTIKVRDDETREVHEETIPVQGRPTEDVGVFYIQTRQPLAERVLSGKVDLDIEVMGNGAAGYMVKITFRAS